jgi:hypothetical protein
MIENYINLWNGYYGTINQVYMVFWHFIAIPMLMYIASYPIRYQRGAWWLIMIAVTWMAVFVWIGVRYGS